MSASICERGIGVISSHITANKKNGVYRLVYALFVLLFYCYSLRFLFLMSICVQPSIFVSISEKGQGSARVVIVIGYIV